MTPMAQVALRSSQRRLSSRVPMWTRPPRCLILAAAALPHLPGPRRGYWKLSIRVLISSPPFSGWSGAAARRSAFDMALHRSRPLIRCAAQSAEISSQVMPHTFSV